MSYSERDPQPSTSRAADPQPSTSRAADEADLLTTSAHDPNPPLDSDFEIDDDDDDDLDRDLAMQLANMDDDDDGDDDEDDELDYVSAHDTSIDEDEPLSVLARRHSSRNEPGSRGWKGWFREDNVPRRHGFCGTPGVKEELGLTSESTPKDILDCLVPPELWEKVVRETNRYHHQHPPNPSSSHMKDWQDTTVEELQQYVGLRTLMGVQPRPTYRHYWSTNPLVNAPVFNETMSRDRYDQLTSNLHFTDNEDPAAAEDRLWKLRPVIDMLGRTFKQTFIPERKIAIDESLWAYRGRHHAVQFNPSKRARFGMKVYKLCSSDGRAAGYTSAFKVYMGQDRSHIPASMKAVMDLMQEAGLFDKGYQLYLDNWYSSPTLFHYLQSRKTEAVGTVRLNRKFMPKDLTVRVKGDVDVRTSRAGMMALAWMDKKQVNMLSTVHRGDEMVDLPPNRHGEVRRKPGCVVDYNNGMKGVDLSDQVAQSYPCARKTNKWYIKIWYNLLDMAIVNAHAIYKYLGGSMTQLDFRLQLISQLLQRPSGNTTAPPRTRSRSRSPRLARSRSPLHPAPRANRPARRQPVPRPAIHGNADPHVLVAFDDGKYRRCRHCREARGMRTMSHFKCEECNVPLCATCFSDYHH